MHIARDITHLPQTIVPPRVTNLPIRNPLRTPCVAISPNPTIRNPLRTPSPRALLVRAPIRLGVAIFPLLLLSLAVLRGPVLLRPALQLVHLALDILLAGEQIEFGDGGLYAGEHAVDGGDVVCVFFVVAPAGGAVAFCFEFPVAGGVAVAFDDAAVEALVEALHDLPFAGGDGQGGEGLVVVLVVLDEERDRAGECVVVGDETFFAVEGVDEREVAKPELEVDRVLVRWFPFQDVSVCAELVACVFACKDQPVVAVLQGW